MPQCGKSPRLTLVNPTRGRAGGGRARGQMHLDRLKRREFITPRGGAAFQVGSHPVEPDGDPVALK